MILAPVYAGHLITHGLQPDGGRVVEGDLLIGTQCGETQDPWRAFGFIDWGAVDCPGGKILSGIGLSGVLKRRQVRGGPANPGPLWVDHGNDDGDVLAEQADASILEDALTKDAYGSLCGTDDEETPFFLTLNAAEYLTHMDQIIHFRPPVSEGHFSHYLRAPEGVLFTLDRSSLRLHLDFVNGMIGPPQGE